MLSIAICDDEIMFATQIESLLLEISKKLLIEVSIEVYSDGAELWSDFLSGKKYDLIYLDIEMDSLNGIEVAKKIRESNINSLIIYISYYEKYCLDLFEVEPFRFIKKPVDENKFFEYFKKAYERIVSDNIFFEYNFNKVTKKIPTKNIMYFESSRRVISIYSKEGNDKFYGKLNNIEKQLDEGKIHFLRIHQSYLVNYRYIKNISFSKVVLLDGTELQISADRRKSIRKKCMLILGEEFFDD